MANQFVGQIAVVGFNFAPYQWATCDGQLMPISQNTALFSLLGTQFGGDGRITYALPNFQGRMPVGQGQLAGGGIYDMGQEAGTETVTLLSSEMPSHNHKFLTDVDTGANSNSPGQAALSSGVSLYTTATSPVAQMNASMVSPAGNSQPHNNMMPFLGLYFIIALQGIYPARS